MPSPKVSIVLVNWNNLEDTVECVDSLVRCTYPAHDVTVVDNGSDGDDAMQLRERFGEAIRLIESTTNVGFAGGSNLGIRDALDRGADYVLLLNNDTVAGPEFLDELVASVGGDPGIGIAGGKILSRGARFFAMSSRS